MLIQGETAADIADSVRVLVQRGELAAGASLPPMRVLAAQLGVNRNTVASAYALLAAAGIVDAHGRAGTTVLGLPKVGGEGEGAPGEGTAAPRTVNLASGNPDPALLPDWSRSFAGYTPILYGEQPIHPRLHDWAERTLPPGPTPGQVTVTSGAVDALERLLAAHLMRGDAVALEDPGFFLSVGTLRVGGYRAVSLEVDPQGVTVASLRDALAAGVRAVVCTMRAQNPTGASLSAERAEHLRALLAEHPDVLVVEDDHFSAIAVTPYRTVIPAGTARWAIVRSMSKFLGPDLRLAVLRADAGTTARLATRLGRPSWVSHLLQHIGAELLTSPAAQERLAEAAAAYPSRRALLVDALAAQGIAVFPAADGFNVWIPLPHDEHRVVTGLAQAGWAVRAGSAYGGSPSRSPAIRVTTATLTADQAAGLAAALHPLLKGN
ncbi:aminotransferase class I/II-fold pyridoxal phosphate-dependent enzyme [Actinoplanes palleronii]|uniref:Transcriptional regulator PtsJ n=1 Tax=Actinoplanes palleronii TaxID=113570 RepID=A0ABQ4BPH3_9ACTN|nr:aminotransferase class I/II-fold pyridoxal phosphate-dependent enzyme [Actinoplanes palleronii]GIE72568.1 transcriptional regulator PtsJ [Actinoplanes palleronii]